MATRTVKLAVVPGDGIGPEVIGEGLKVLKVAAAQHDLAFETTEYELGADLWHRTGEALPASVQEELAQQEAIYLGAVGDPRSPAESWSAACCSSCASTSTTTSTCAPCSCSPA